MNNIASINVFMYVLVVEKNQWNFFTNHSHVLICLSEDPNRTVRDISLAIGITERSVLGIIKDLADAGVLKIQKQGRRNVYLINQEAKLRHPLEEHCQIGQILGTIKSVRNQ